MARLATVKIQLDDQVRIINTTDFKIAESTLRAAGWSVVGESDGKDKSLAPKSTAGADNSKPKRKRRTKSEIAEAAAAAELEDAAETPDMIIYEGLEEGTNPEDLIDE